MVRPPRTRAVQALDPDAVIHDGPPWDPRRERVDLTLPADVTVELQRDDKVENRVYRTSSGHVIKLKTWQEEGPQAGIAQFYMTGSICDETGAALRKADGSPMIVEPGQRVGITGLWRSDKRTPAEHIAEAQVDYVLLLERMAKLMDAPLPVGVAPMAAKS